MDQGEWFDGPGVPKLMEQLSAICGESVSLRFVPAPLREIRWKVSTHNLDSPALGEGTTPWMALEDAFSRVVARIFRGEVPATGRRWEGRPEEPMRSALGRARAHGRNVLPDATDDQAHVIEVWADEALR